MGWGNESLFKLSRSHVQDGHHAYILWLKVSGIPKYGKKSPETKRLMTLKVDMQHRVLKCYQVCSSDDPGLTLIYFMARSNFCALCFCRGRRNRKANDLETWYAASSTEYCQVCSSEAPGLTLTYFTVRSDLVPYAFVQCNLLTLF